MSELANVHAHPDVRELPRALTPSAWTFKASDLGVDAGDRALLRGVSLSLRNGDLLAITGRSGGGKSLLLRALCGIDDPASGEVRLNDEPAGTGGWPAYRQRVMLVPTLHPVLTGTVRENFTIPCGFMDSVPAPDDAQIRTLLDALRVEAPLDQQASELSTGEQRRVALARALWMHPSVLLVDEPTNGLDARSAGAVAAVLQTYVAAPELPEDEACYDPFGSAYSPDRIVVMVSHDQALVDRVATQRLDIDAFRVPEGTA